MTPTDTPLTDQELNALFAEKVDGFEPRRSLRNGVEVVTYWQCNLEYYAHQLPVYTDDANAVLKWLNKQCSWIAEKVGNDFDVGVVTWSGSRIPRCTAPTFARAACLALLKSKGVEFPVSGKGKG